MFVLFLQPARWHNGPPKLPGSGLRALIEYLDLLAERSRRADPRRPCPAALPRGTGKPTEPYAASFIEGNPASAIASSASS